MQFILMILLAAITLVIAYQDFTERAVMWILFPALAAVGIFSGYVLQSDSQLLIIQTGTNWLFIVVQLSVLWLFFTLRGVNARTLLNEKLGIGDILFFFASACFFSIESYILFHIISLGFVLVVYILFNKIKRMKTIPLAGLQSLFLLGFKLIYND